MIRPLLALVIAAISALAIGMPSAKADGTCHFVEVTRFVDGGIVSTLVEVCDDAAPGVPGSSDAAPVIPTTLGSALCIAGAQLAGADPTEFCGEDDEVQVVTGDLVQRALARTSLPPSVLVVQPPNGRTLVNFETNFLTEREPFTRTVTLLGQQVDLRIFPAQFTWFFDDGASLTTTSPGARYPDLEITHDYRRRGVYSPSVDTTYAADWRIGGGAWQRVPGTVTIAGEAVELEAVEARPTLVSTR